MGFLLPFIFEKTRNYLCFRNYLSSSKLLHITLLHTPTHSPLHIYIHQNCFILSSYITSRSFVHYLFLVVFVFLCTSFPFCFHCPVSHSHRFAVFVCWGGWVRVHNHTHTRNYLKCRLIGRFRQMVLFLYIGVADRG